MTEPLSVSPNNRTLNWAVACGVILLAVGGFTLSFSSLRDIAIASGIYARLAFLWPLIVDGFIVVSTASAFALKSRGRRVTWYPWASIVMFSGISVSGNALHALEATDLHVSVAVAAIVSAVPAIALLVASHLLVLMIGGRSRSSRRPRSDAPTSGELSAVSRAGSSHPVALHAVNTTDHDLLAGVRALITRGETVTGATIARLADVSERTGRRRLEDLRKHHPDLLERQAELSDAQQSRS